MREEIGKAVAAPLPSMDNQGELYIMTYPCLQGEYEGDTCILRHV